MAQSKEAKQKAYRIPHDYHRSADPTERAKQVVTCLALVATLIIVTWLMIAPRSTQTWHSPGPIAQPHAMFEHDCQACHVDFTPIRSDAACLLKQSDPEAGVWGSATDQKCRHCHEVSRHNAAEISTEVAGCAACHRDHQGLSFPLSRVADSTCVACHGSLGEHVAQASEASGLQNVTAFHVDHPEFRSLASDPGLIKFPHDVHLKPGQPLYDASKKRYTKPLKSLKDLAPDDRQRYTKAGQADRLVRLACADCHTTDHSLDKRMTGLLTSDGRHMQPIRFESHCQACHALELTSIETEVPHGLLLSELRPWLEKELTTRLTAEEAPEGLADRGRLDPVPGEPSQQTKQNLRQQAEEQLQRALSQLHTTCVKCHVMQENEVKVARPMIPTKWLQHARFDHAAHTAVSCQACHAGAAINEALSGGPQASHERANVLIPGRELCAQCHRPSTAKLGGARSDCAECHRYHGGSHSLAPSTEPVEPRSIEAFIRSRVGQAKR